MPRFIDIHQHIIYGMDDGPCDFEGTKKMLRNAALDGIGHIIATPHFCMGKKTWDMGKYLWKIERINAFCAGCGIDLTIHGGAEIYLPEAASGGMGKGGLLTLAGSRCVLVEFGRKTAYPAIFAAVRSLSHAGYVPVLAHVERYPCLMRRPERVRELREFLYAKMQVNCDTLLGKCSARVRNSIRRLLGEGLIDYVATDAHDAALRKCTMSECFRFLESFCGAEYASALTGGNQAEIILGASGSFK